MKIFGCILLIIGSAVLTFNDIRIDTLAYWAIYLSLFVGGGIVFNEES